jgi:hypothetical protein
MKYILTALIKEETVLPSYCEVSLLPAPDPLQALAILA